MLLLDQIFKSPAFNSIKHFNCWTALVDTTQNSQIDLLRTLLTFTEGYTIQISTLEEPWLDWATLEYVENK